MFYRSYKQTMQRRKLLSRTAATCLAEVHWTLLGLWLLGLMTALRLIGQGIDPLAISVARRPRRGAARRAGQAAPAWPTGPGWGVCARR